MAGNFLLDTNIVIGLLKPDPAIQSRSFGKQLFFSLTTLGELRYGASKSRHHVANHAKIDIYLSAVPLLMPDDDTARFYGELKARMKTVGKRIPDNDIWIAAIAMQFDLIVVTRDKHFSFVDGLAVEKW